MYRFVSEQGAVSASRPMNELNNGVVDLALLCGIASFTTVQLEDEQVSVTDNGVELVADGCKLDLDDGLVQ